jgi:hypothetical protein
VVGMGKREWGSTKMGRRRLQFKKVRKSEFDKACEWISQHCESVRGTIRNPRPILNVTDFLDKFRNQDWDTDVGSEIGFEIVISKLNDATTAILASDVRKYLRAASIALGFESILNIRHEVGRRFSPYWEDQPRAAAAVLSQARDKRDFSTIAIFGELIAVEFSAEFIRGAYSMARELDIQISDLRTSKTLCDMGDDFLIQAAGKLDHTTTSILIPFDNTEHTAEQADHLKKQHFHVVGIGHRQRALSIDNDTLARSLAGQCNADHQAGKANGKRTVYFLQLRRRVSSRDYVIRTPGLKRALLSSGLFDVQEIIVAQSQVPPHDGSPRVIASVEDALQKIDPSRAAALFPRIDPFTKMAIRWIAANEPYRHIKVYGEKLLSRDLAMLSDPESPLAAVCGVDPYHYGRYAVRAASMRLGGVKLPELPPVLITKREAAERHICMIDRVPANFKGCDLKLHGPAFAWFDWMRECCPSSFGPDLLGQG